MASNEKIQAIRERLDILQVIGAHVSLKKQGQRYVGLCPFHNEKTPSFSVSPDKGLFYCFGCHAGGDAFAFVMRHAGVDFLEAARRLGELVGVALEGDSVARRERRRAEDELARVNAVAQAFFERALWGPAGQHARAYLKQRGVPERVAQSFRLGFGGRPKELLAHLDAQGVARELAARAGLLSDDGERSLFDARLVFPVFDSLGRLSGFGARRLGEGPGPKYINSRETVLFHKRKLLFGWEHAERAMRSGGRVVLVEGYMDVIACHMAGIHEAVAALGTSLTEEHARLCARFAKRALLLLDGDAAGRAASFKAAERLIAAGLKADVAPLPDGRDPADLLREQGHEALAQLVERAQPAIDYFLEHAFTQAGAIEERARAARELWPLLRALGAGLEYDLYLARLADRVGVAPAQLAKHLQAAAVDNDAGRRRPHTARLAEVESPPKPEPQVRVDAVELDMVRELLLYPELRPRLGELAEYALCDSIRELLEQLAATDAPVAEVVGRCLGGVRQAARLARVQPLVADEESALRAQRTYDDVLVRMKARHVDAALKDMIRELAAVEARGGDTSELIRKTQDLTRRKKALLGSRQSA